MMLVVVHEAYVIASGDLHDVDPFVHVLAEMAIFIPAGAMLLAAVAKVRNRLVRD